MSLCLSVCFSRAPWTLAVCFVLLPVLRQLLTTQTDERYTNINKITKITLISLSPPPPSLPAGVCVWCVMYSI